jgi:hypothetical protein
MVRKHHALHDLVKRITACLGDIMPDVPGNIAEFNAIAAVVFGQLYKAFPAIEDIDRDEIARRMGSERPDWHAHRLASGRLLGDMIGFTIRWLTREGYIRSEGSHPAQKAVLTTNGLKAMNMIPQGLQHTLGEELQKETAPPLEPSRGPDVSRIGELIGGFFGGLTKSISSG